MIENDVNSSLYIQIIQHNANRLKESMYSCLESAVQNKTDFILLQESWIASDNISTISHNAYYCILSSCLSSIRSRVVVYARKNSYFKYCLRTDLTSDADIMILDISSSNIDTFQLINIYNEKDQSAKMIENTLLKEFWKILTLQVKLWLLMISTHIIADEIQKFKVQLELTTWFHD